MTLLTVYACRREMSADEYAKRGDHFFSEGKYDEAYLAYRNAIKKTPQAGDVHVALARTEIRRGRTAQAVAALQRAKALLPGSITPLMVECDLTLAATMANPTQPELKSRLMHCADEILDKDRDSISGKRLRAHALALTGHIAAAVALFEVVNASTPNNTETVVALTQLLIAQGQFGRAEELALQLLSAKPGAVTAYDVLYRHYRTTERHRDAEALLRRKVAANPGVIDYRLQLASHFRARGHRADADAMLQRTLSDYRDRPEAFDKVASFYIELKDLERAKNTLQAGVKATQQDAALMIRHAMVTAISGDGVGALRLINDALARHPDNLTVRTARTEILLQAGDPEHAIAAAKELIAVDGRNPVHQFHLGRGYLLMGARRNAIDAFTRSVRQQPSFIPALAALAQISLDVREYHIAMRHADAILAIVPNHETASLYRATALAGLGRIAEARGALNVIAATPHTPTADAARVQLALIDASEGRYSVAEKRLANVVDRTAAHVNDALLRIRLARGDCGTAKRLAALLKARTPTEVSALLAHADTVATCDGPRAALTEYSALAVRTGSDALFIRIAECHFAIGDFVSAAAAVRRAVAIAPDNATHVAMLGSVMERMGDVRAAQAEYRRAIQLDSHNIMALNNLAYSLAAMGTSLDEAQRLAERAVSEVDDATTRHTLSTIKHRRRTLGR